MVETLFEQGFCGFEEIPRRCAPRNDRTTGHALFGVKAAGSAVRLFDQIGHLSGRADTWHPTPETSLLAFLGTQPVFHQTVRMRMHAA